MPPQKENSINSPTAVLEVIYLTYSVVALVSLLIMVVLSFRDPSGGFVFVFIIPVFLFATVVNPVLILRNIKRLISSQRPMPDTRMIWLRLVVYTLMLVPGLLFVFQALFSK